MADTDDVKEQEASQEKPEAAQEKSEAKQETSEAKQETSVATQEKSDDEKSSKRSLLPWIITALIVVFCAGAGFGLGRLFAGPGKEEPAGDAAAGPEKSENVKTELPDLTAKDSQKTWYFDLDPVVANLDEPSVTRYIRVLITLQISSDVDQKKGTEFLTEKMPLLTNWLTIYLAGLSIEDIRGDKNLQRIQTQIRDYLNEKLFPDSKPQIKGILFKEFAIQ